MARHSDGLIWEHSWDLVRDAETMLETAVQDGRIPGVSLRTINQPIYLPFNRGAWTVFELAPEKTLVLVRVNAGLGGIFPNKLVSAYATRQLRRGFEALRAMSADVHDSYIEDPTIFDGFGLPISRQVALDTALGGAEQTTLAKTD